MSTIIFDFDGTIADSFSSVIELARELTDRPSPVPTEEIERLRGMSMLQVAEELKIRPWKVPFLLARGRKRMHSEMSKIKVFPGMPKTIKRLSAAGHNLYIMSSNSGSNIQLFLQNSDLTDEFIKIYGGVGLFGKARVLKRLLKQNGLQQNDSFYIGDEVRDIEAAKHAGVRIVSVTWGYNNETAIARHEPDFIAHAPAELTAMFATMNADGK